MSTGLLQHMNEVDGEHVSKLGQPTAFLWQKIAIKQIHTSYFEASDNILHSHSLIPYLTEHKHRPCYNFTVVPQYVTIELFFPTLVV